MAGFVEIPIPAELKDHDEEFLCCYFQDRVIDVGCRFSVALDLACDQRTTHAILERVTINDVSVAGDRIQIGYHVELSEFQACKDSMCNYSFKRTVFGRKFGGVWRFDKFVPASERSTCDEL